MVKLPVSMEEATATGNGRVGPNLHIQRNMLGLSSVFKSGYQFSLSLRQVPPWAQTFKEVGVLRSLQRKKSRRGGEVVRKKEYLS